MNRFDDLDLACRFHGHLGPNLVIGLKMGNYAVAALSARRHFGMRVEVSCPASPPGSCVIDGLQLATGCTMGKANLVHAKSQDGARVTFTNTETEESITLRIRDGLQEQAGAWCSEIGEDDASRRVWEMRDEEVFTVCST